VQATRGPTSALPMRPAGHQDADGRGRPPDQVRSHQRKVGTQGPPHGLGVMATQSGGAGPARVWSFLTLTEAIGLVEVAMPASNERASLPSSLR
jgi:hypothetical protein